MLIWSSASAKQPLDVAREFAAMYFHDPPRRVAPATFRGEWTAAGWRGEFMLIDGTRAYGLRSDLAGVWCVTRAEGQADA